MERKCLMPHCLEQCFFNGALLVYGWDHSSQERDLSGIAGFLAPLACRHWLRVTFSIVSAPKLSHTFILGCSVQGWCSLVFRGNWGLYPFPVKPFILYHCYYFERTAWCIHAGVIHVNPSHSMHLLYCIIPLICFQTVLLPPRALSSLKLNFDT